MSYQPIEDYGVIGDMHTVALVGKDGSIDWMCYPDFDSPSMFGALLDDEKGGCFRVAPTCRIAANKQLYWPETNVLITRFLSPDGVGEVTDFMPIRQDPGRDGNGMIVRRVTAARGTMPFRVHCRPRFDFARAEHEVQLLDEGACFHSDGLSIGLASEIPLDVRGDATEADFTLEEGEFVTFVLRRVDHGDGCGPVLSPEDSRVLFGRTVDFWRAWIRQCSYKGRWRETVHRSALVLKLLTYQPTGAIVAAPTCSLPEDVGGVRNWDYRYTWIRDASFTLYAFLRLGFTDEAARFMEWLDARTHELEPDGRLQVLYGIDGRHDVHEETLDHLDGYRGSRPVRVGNAAYDQLQLDIYGELMDAIYLYNKHGSWIPYQLWQYLLKMIGWVVDHWQEPDEGIWEVRGGRRQFVFSKAMCWVALDRALRVADKRSFPAPRQEWLAARDAIYREVMERGWSEERSSFVQAYDGDVLDASSLMLPLVFFVAPTDERMLQTLEAVDQSPNQGGLVSSGLVYRYNLDETGDGVSGEEGTFNICTFWLVEAMTRAGKERPELLERARLLFEHMLSYANHLGLYAEETGASGEALGNYPQAFTHLGLISAAVNLDRMLDEST